jgi:hypothetical protein
MSKPQSLTASRLTRLGQFHELTTGQYYDRLGAAECALARRYGAMLTDAGDIKKFYDAVRPTVVDNMALLRLMYTTNEVVKGFVEADSIKDAASAIGARRMLSEHMLYGGPTEDKIITAALSHLQGDNLIAFAALLSPKGLMFLSVALGYQPSATFDKLVEAYKAEERRRQEEEERQRRLHLFG